ncbi:hypothetical protein SAMN05216378_4101 [Paenibacillus catalpae]|uniref:Uncharacterized protein n=1 Tax=Paenibacillus catalpae TaxID=1045775 RepID=A0A1I2DGH0_9BACL|nr:hypothetical protein [Paenibacillus catalpae]SFE79549.1 hypothetical protein SAMN05216378_4101 [Paenibacillus catalpae]
MTPDTMTQEQVENVPNRNIYEQFTKSDYGWIIGIKTYLSLMVVLCTIFLFPEVSLRVTGFDVEKVTDTSSLHYYFFNVFVAGVLGSSIYGLRRIYTKLTKPVDTTNKELSDSFRIKLWLSTFVYKPLMGGALSIMTLALLNAGFMSLSQGEGITSTAVSIQALYFQIGFGFLVGFGSNEVIKKVDQIIAFTFQPNKEQK